MDGELQVCALHLIGSLLGDVKKPSVTASLTGLEILELTLFLTKFKLTLVIICLAPKHNVLHDSSI